MKYLSLLIIFSSAIAHAQFEEHSIIACEICGPKHIKIGDINNDGFLDVVIYSERDEKLSYYPSLDGRKFGPLQVITNTLQKINFMKLLDYDNDGYLDVVFEFQKKSELAYFKGSADATFEFIHIASTIQMKMPKHNGSLEDIDHDGQIDYFVNDRRSTPLLMKNQKGDFVKSQLILNGKAYLEEWEYHFYEINGDEKTDIITISKDRLKLNIWTTTKSEGYIHQQVDLPEKIYNVAAESRTNKSKADLVVGAENGIFHLVADQKGVYQSSKIYSKNYLSFSKPKFADLNGDGFEEIIFQLGITFGLLKNTKGTFKNSKPIFSFSTGSIGACDINDIDQDGYSDVVFAHDNDISIHFGNAILDEDWFAKESMHRIQITNPNYYPTSIAVSDLNGDGSPDIIAASSLNDHINLYENKNAHFEKQPKLYRIVGCGNQTIRIGDFNMDGGVDFINHTVKREQCFLFQNDGKGGFAKQAFPLTSDTDLEMIPDDLDGDGDLDLVTKTYKKFYWFENDGTGEYADKELIFITKHEVLSDWEIGDVDNDGNRDIVFAYTEYDFEKKKCLTQTGGLVIKFLDDFQKNIETVEYKLDPKPEYFELDDTNNDGNLDVVFAKNGNSKNIFIMTNNGEGAFQETINIPTSIGQPYSCFVHDLDGDCDKDIVVTSLRKELLVWLEKLEDGSYREHKITTTNTPRSIYFHDVDQDLDVDIISLSDNSMEWFENKIPQKNLSHCGFSKEYQVKTFQNKGYEINLYPNPTQDILNIESEIELKLDIFNNNGLKIKTRRINEGSNQISIAELPASVYFLEFKSKKQNYSTSRKVVKVE